MISKEAQQLFTMCSIVIYSISSNFFFIPQKDLFCWQWYWNFFFFFCSNKIFISFSGLFRSFCIFHLQKDFNIFRMLLFGVFLCSEGSNHIDNSVCDKSMKLSELHYNVTRNDFFNRDTLYIHVGADVSIFLAANYFLINHVNLYTVGTPIQCWSKFPWELWSKNVRFPR